MKYYLLNIGVNGMPESIADAKEVFRACAEAGLSPSWVKSYPAKGEIEAGYAVFVSESSYEESKVYQLSETLQQDCIAVMPVAIDGFQIGEGKLIGPEARKWAPFNLNYFTGFKDL